jgi:hypothetical protein
VIVAAVVAVAIPVAAKLHPMHSAALKRRNCVLEKLIHHLSLKNEYSFT